MHCNISQDSAGMVTSDHNNFFAHRGMGQVSIFSDNKLLNELKGKSALVTIDMEQQVNLL